MNTIKIIPNGNTSYDVFLNDINISNCVRGINISMTAGRIPFVNIAIAAGKVEIPEELLALVVAEKEEDK